MISRISKTFAWLKKQIRRAKGQLVCCHCIERPQGVLTKPDIILPSSMGQLQKWRDVLEGKAYPLEHGYYCVRLADEAERMKRLSRAESERLADGFFRTRDPWSQMSLCSRFGIPNLVRNVSTLLVLWIEKKYVTNCDCTVDTNISLSR